MRCCAVAIGASVMKIFVFSSVAWIVVASGFAAEGIVLEPVFEGGRKINYQRNTAIDTSAAEVDFTVSCTRTGTCATAWGIISKPMHVPNHVSFYVFEFEMRADRDWIKPKTTGEKYDTAINWLDAEGRRIGRRRLNIEFFKGRFAQFRFVGEVPKPARQMEVQFGVDSPDLSIEEKVIVRNSRFTLLAEKLAEPSERIPDIRGPVVFSRFVSPSMDANLKASYEICDYTAVEWSSVSVTDVVKKTSVPFVRKGSRIMLTPGAPWSEGRHIIDVAVKDVLGNATVSRKVFLIGETPKKQTVTLRADGMTLVDGKPFFPIGMYAVSPYAFNGDSLDTALRDLKEAGFNTVHSYRNKFDPELFAAAAKYGMRQWTSGQDAGKTKNSWFVSTGRVDRTVLAWYIGDDTSAKISPGQLLDRDEAVKMLDASRITCQADAVGANAAKSNYQEYVNYADVFMPEIYPVNGHKDELFVAEVRRDMERCWADIRNYGDGKRPRGVWPILQCFHGKSWKRYPTAQEMYAMSFAALVHGGNGIIWYKYGGEIGEKGASYSGMFRTPEDWCAMTNITRRIAMMAPVLTEPTPSQPSPPEIVSGPKLDAFGLPSVTMLMKFHRDACYVFAVNAMNEKVRARFRLGVAKTAKVSVVWERREIEMSGGVFDDDFEPFGVHVYRLDGY